MFPLRLPFAGLHLCASLGLTLIAGSIATAELPTTRLDRIRPLGAAAGSSVEVELLGRDTDDVTQLIFDQPGLTAELLSKAKFRVTISADVPEGTYDARTFGKNGVSNPRLFVVSKGLTEVREKEPNNRPDVAQQVELNSVIDAESDGNGQDLFRFKASAGQRVVLDCQAERLESNLDAVLILQSVDGRQLASSGDYHGRDPLIDFVSPADAEYLVVVHDLSFRGGQQYRLNITTRPHLENLFPPVVQVGQPASLIARGRNLPGAAPVAIQGIEPALQELPLQITPPGDLLDLGAYRFLEHPTDHTVAPTAATMTLIGFQSRGLPQLDALRPQNLLLVNSPVTLEQEPNNDPMQPQRLGALPVALAGRFEQSRDGDWYELELDKDEELEFEVYSERIAGRADPFLMIQDDKGATVAEFDDYGPRMNGFDGHLRDPYGTFNLQGKKKYRLLVQDRYGRGGPRYQYVLAIRRLVPEFFVSAMHRENQEPGGVTVRAGSATYLDLACDFRGKFRGPITITAEGLPPGVQMGPAIVNNTQLGTLVLQAGLDAPSGNSSVRLFATAKVGDREIRHEVRPYTRVFNEQSSRPVRSLVVGVTETGPYALRFAPDRVTVEAGKSIEVKLVATRNWPEFKDKINVIPLNLPGFLQVGNQEIGAERTETAFNIQIQPGTAAGDYTLTMLGQGQVPFKPDSKKPDIVQTLVTIPAVPLIISVTAPPK